MPFINFFRRGVAILLAGPIVMAGISQAATGATLFSADAAVTEAELGAISGRDDLMMIATADNSSTVTNNRVIGNSVTGTINFNEHAFSDMNGLSLISANTGNNVSINAAMVVNVALNPTN